MITETERSINKKAENSLRNAGIQFEHIRVFGGDVKHYIHIVTREENCAIEFSKILRGMVDNLKISKTLYEDDVNVGTEDNPSVHDSFFVYAEF